MSIILIAAAAISLAGEVSDKGAIQKMVDEAAAKGGGVVEVGAGVWHTGPIHLRSNIELHLDEGAVLEFSDDPKDYLPAVETSWEGVECYNYSPLVYAYGCTNIALTGKGKLAPRMGTWKQWFKRPPEHMKATETLYHWCSTNAPVAKRDLTALPGSNMRPHLIQFNRCRNVRIENIVIRNSPFWTTHLYCCDDCVVRGVDSYAHGHNNDGIDIESCGNVLVENCTFNQGDDGVVIKAGRNQDAWRVGRSSHDIEIRNVTLVDGHGLLVVGSEMAGGVERVYMHDCKAIGELRNFIYLKTNERRGGFIRDIKVENCEGNLCNAGSGHSALLNIETDVLYQWAKYPTYEKRITDIDGITLRNCHLKKAQHLLNLQGDERKPIKNVILENVTLDECTGEKFRIKNANYKFRDR